MHIAFSVSIQQSPYVNFEILRIKECSHPQDGSRTYLVQIAVDEKPCIPFYDHEINRRTLGEEAWIESLKSNAAGLLREYGPQPVIA